MSEKKVKFEEGDLLSKAMVGGFIWKAKHGVFTRNGRRDKVIIIEKLDSNGKWTGQRLIIEDNPKIKSELKRFFDVFFKSW